MFILYICLNNRLMTVPVIGKSTAEFLVKHLRVSGGTVRLWNTKTKQFVKV